MGMLEEILKNKREELKVRKGSLAFRELKNMVMDAEATRGFRDAIKRDKGPLRLIAEVKKASPSGGLLRKDFDLSEILSVYEKKAVDAISVLTDKRFFGGSIDYLKSAQRQTTRPLLRKDFIIDEYQVYESRVYGADAILLIVSALERSHLIDLMGQAEELSLDCLVEVHDLKELDTALYCGSQIIGINNRNLKTLEVNIETTYKLIKDIPDDRVIVSESGIEKREDVEGIESTKVDAILIGTSIMKADDVGEKIDELMGKKG